MDIARQIMEAMLARDRAGFGELEGGAAVGNPLLTQQGRRARMLQPFRPEGHGYDYRTAIGAGMGPDGTGENAGHWGSVAPITAALTGEPLPDDSYMMLKGRQHPTWQLGVAGEEQRGSRVVKMGDRYYSVPNR
jgi:hypothetical protein